MKSLHERLHTVPQIGRVEWIGVAPAAHADIKPVTRVEAKEGSGLVGDHHSKRRPGGNRQVTLIQSEHLPVVAVLVGQPKIDPADLRRNIVVSGINLLSLKGLLFRIGDAILRGTGPCDPCSRMEENLGEGGFQAMRGHGGLTARVIHGGAIHVGDPVRVIDEVGRDGGDQFSDEADDEYGDAGDDE